MAFEAGVNSGWVNNCGTELFTLGWVQCETQPATRPATQPGAHWKHLWRPVREVVTEPLSVRAGARVTFPTPELRPNNYTEAVTPTTQLRARAGVLYEQPRSGAVPPAFRFKPNAGVSVTRPVGTTRTPYRRESVWVCINKLAPIGETTTPAISVSARGYYSFWTPETIQNPTEELISIL